MDEDEANHRREAQARRRLIAPGVAVGLTEAMIAEMVHTFYGRIREHAVLGPIFEDALRDHWDEHLAKLVDFWSSVLLMTGRFKGSPMAAHAGNPHVEDGHFALWLALFHRTADDVLPPGPASLFKAKADMIGESLRQGLAVCRASENAGRTRTVLTPPEA